ncbi:MAG: B-box zinc finger protein [Chloroflexi bacterium]|nr:B-box zinc finger protein [Chloroflexota bacterium]
MRCAAHPNAETNLSCATCQKPICPRCMIETPVGMKCRKCARLQRLPTFRLSLKHYLRAGGAGLGAAAVFAVARYLLLSVVPLAGIFGFFIAAAVGYGIGEIIYRASGHKRGLGLAVVAGASVVLSYLLDVRILVAAITFEPSGLLRSALNLVSIAVGVAAAAWRVK